LIAVTHFQHDWDIPISHTWVSDSYCVYPKFINPEDHIVSKPYMTRVEGENTRLRHYLARLHRKTLCYSKSKEMLQISISLLLF
ncbi:MAG: IS1 family transposase, partial [Pseudanabaena sp.]